MKIFISDWSGGENVRRRETVKNQIKFTRDEGGDEVKSSAETKDPNLVTYKYHKNLKISVFGGPKQYLVLFVFGKWTLWENLVFFDLQIVF